MKKEKVKKILKIINVIIILFCIFYYSGRLVFYWYKQNNSGKEMELLTDRILKNISYIDLSNGLIENEDGTYIYKGKTENNYLKYSGRLFRIISLDKEKNIKIVSNASESIFAQNSTETEPSIQRWLNYGENEFEGIYYNTLNNQDIYLASTTVCTDKITDAENITCSIINSDESISLLSLYDYSETGGAEGYLNNGENYWLSTRNDSGEYWVVLNDGTISTSNKINSFYDVRAVLTLKNSIEVFSGKGTESDPYIIENPNTKVEFLMDVNVGDYINYSKYDWKVVSRSATEVQLALDGYFKFDEEEVNKAFSTGSNIFANTKGSLAYYLNNDFYNTLENKEVIVKSLWYIGQLMSYDTFNYKDLYNKTVELNVGALKIDDLYVNEYNNIFLLSRPYGDANLIYTINEDGNIFMNFVTEELKVRPSVKLQGSASISSGKGTKENPYKLTEVQNESTQ